MPKTVQEILRNGGSYDETDRIPQNITITNLDILMYIVAIVGHLVDLGVDINIAVRYSLARNMVEFGWTLAFIVIPAFVNTAVSARMYIQDRQQETAPPECKKHWWLRTVMLGLQLAPIMRIIDALMYALKSRRAERNRDVPAQRKYYARMLREDADAALLRVFECFLEAAPQHVLQASLLLRRVDHFTVHQTLSIASSVASMGWCLAAYQRAVRFAQQDKLNMDWLGSLLQTLWHFLVTLSRVISLSIIAYLYPHWTVLACTIHIVVMAAWLQLFDRSPFCSHSRIGEFAFSFALGAVYLFTHILPTEGRTRYRYAVYYSICFVQNVCCTTVWYLYANEDMRRSLYFYPVLVLSILPFILGMLFMMVYYMFFHPKVRKGVRDVTVTFKVNDQIAEAS